MDVHSFPPHRSRRDRQGGISLIIVLIMLVVIGMTSAATIRSATSDERVSNNMRMQNLAQQYAEAALRYCESQVAMPDADPTRVATLKEGILVQTDIGGAPAWNHDYAWTGIGGVALASLTTVPESQIKSLDSSFRPTVLPQCVVEKQVVEVAKPAAYVITARGFSPDYTADAATGKTTGGSVVWLQATLAF
jgi:type IV pilus assembly protein PilX